MLARLNVSMCLVFWREIIACFYRESNSSIPLSFLVLSCAQPCIRFDYETVSQVLCAFLILMEKRVI